MIKQLREWIRQMMDPNMRAQRRERKKAEEMARFLDRNHQADSSSSDS